jgi:peptidoglycan hydrolase FlgJ
MAAATTSLYNDFAGLAALKYQARKDQNGSAGQVAKQFESLFMQMMVKQMRQASFGGGILDSDRTRFYKEMYDKQLSLYLSEHGGMGMGKVLRRQLGVPEQTPTTVLTGLEAYRRHPVAAVSHQPQADEVAQAPAAQAAATAADTACAPPSMDSPESFVQHLWSCAQDAATQLGLPPEALLAQAALETGWGNFVMSSVNGVSSHNLFGIKADQRWDGGQVGKETLEFEQGVAVRKRERFRTYASYEQSFQDYVAFLKSNPRYAQALEQTQDPAAYFKALQDAGYATDPDYADKILRVMQGPEMQTALDQFKASARQPI